MDDEGFTRGRGLRPEAYSRVQIVLHWLVAALIVVQYASSGAIVRTHTVHLIGWRPSQADLVLHGVHNRVGLVIVALMMVRLTVRSWAGVPRPGGPRRAWSSRAAGFVHAAFYAVLITEGVTGAVASYLWWPISLAHVILFKILMGLLALHVAAALWHRFYLRDATLDRLGLRRLFG